VENESTSGNIDEGELLQEPCSLTDSDRLVWLMDHVRCDEVPGIGIPFGLPRQVQRAVFRTAIDFQILKERRG
jgi:hypothetical protein